MDQPDVFRRMIEVLDSASIPYAIVGSVAAISYGESRMTVDMDVLVQLAEQHIPLLIQSFPGPDWYLSEAAMRDAIRKRRQFNVIHPLSGNKVDIIMGRSDDDARTLLRATRRPIQPNVNALVAHPNDVILGKLKYYGEGGSQKHLSDIAAILRVSGLHVDVDELTGKAAELGLLSVWESIQEHVRNTPLPPSDL